MSLSTFILSELYSGGVLYGGELTRRFEAAKILSWGRVSPSSVYRALSRLREKGLVARWSETTARRNRKFFAITREGRKAFESLLSGELAEPRTYRNPLNIAVHCVRALPRKRAVALLEARTRRLAGHEAAAAEIARLAMRASPAPQPRGKTKSGGLSESLEGDYERLAAERILMKTRAELFFAGSLADLLRSTG